MSATHPFLPTPACRVFPLLLILFASPLMAQTGQTPETDRLLASGTDYQLLLREGRCERTMNVDVRSRSASVLRPGSERLRRILAVARAVLSFECPDLRGLEVHGHDQSTGTTRLSGRALRKNDWEFVSHYAEEDKPISQTVPLETSERFSVANLSVGMTLTDAHQTLTGIYNDVRYRERRRVLVAGTEGCGSRRARLEARMNATNQHCIRAWFTDENTPRLQRLMLVQRVEGNQKRVGERTLRERFGRPVNLSWHDPSAQHERAGFGEVSRLRWGKEVSTSRDGKGSHELEADILNNDYSTELILRMQGRVDRDTDRSDDNPFIY